MRAFGVLGEDKMFSADYAQNNNDQTILNHILNMDYYGLVVVNIEGQIIFVNETFAELFNLEQRELIGKEHNKFLHDAKMLRIESVIKKGQPEIGEVHIINGRTLVVNHFPIYEKGKLIGVVGQVIFGDYQKFNNRYQNVNLKTRENEHSETKYDINDIIGCSAQIASLKETMCKTATRNSTVLIRGESGTGKELFAHATHNLSLRRNKPFIKINCTAIPEHLLESELFGYVEGAFTGASKGGRKGKFEMANNGTIFLDEIGDMSFNMQAKILRALQEKEFEPVGSHETKTVDVRIIAATNVHLEELIEARKFREDLYYRLNVVALNISPLRERKEDIDPLVEYFIGKFSESFSLNVEKVSPRVMDIFRRYDWPGNVREIENILEQAFNFVEGNVITLDYIPEYIISRVAEKKETNDHMQIAINRENQERKDGILSEHRDRALINPAEYIKREEKEIILRALNESNGNKTKTARMLGISRTALYKKLAKFKIST